MTDKDRDNYLRNMIAATLATKGVEFGRATELALGVAETIERHFMFEVIEVTNIQGASQ